MARVLNKFFQINRLLLKTQMTRNIIVNRTMASITTTDVRTFGSIRELNDMLTKITGIDRTYKPIRENRDHLAQYLPKSQNDLPARSMKDSFLEAYIPLSTDRKLHDKYITFLGHVRVGRLLEDMDIFAVMVAHKHILNPLLPENMPSAHVFVTALVDRIDFTDFTPKSNEDIKLSGHVSWVGKSSMEVVVWLEQKLHGTWHRITRALFLMVARNSANTGPAIVNPLVPGDEREKQILSGGEQRKSNRIALQRQHVSKVVPTGDELRIVHDLYMRTKNEKVSSLKDIVLPRGCEWMENCTASNIIFSQPENRNMHNTVFGGFIMRQALELSWTLGFRFSKYRPKIKSISDISFAKPIAVSSLIEMHAFVVFTHMQYFQITVYVETFDPNTGRNATTNTFHCTYEIPEIVPEIIPRTYHETMMYIDGRRHFFEIMKVEEDHTLDVNAEQITKSKL